MRVIVIKNGARAEADIPVLRFPRRRTKKHTVAAALTPTPRQALLLRHVAVHLREEGTPAPLGWLAGMVRLSRNMTLAHVRHLTNTGHLNHGDVDTGPGRLKKMRREWGRRPRPDGLTQLRLFAAAD